MGATVVFHGKLDDETAKNKLTPATITVLESAIKSGQHPDCQQAGTETNPTKGTINVDLGKDRVFRYSNGKTPIYTLSPIPSREVGIIGVQHHLAKHNKPQWKGETAQIKIETDKDPQSSTQGKQMLSVNGIPLGCVPEETVIPEGLEGQARIYSQPSKLELRLGESEKIEISKLPTDLDPSTWLGQPVKVTFNRAPNEAAFEARIGDTVIGSTNSKISKHFFKQDPTTGMIQGQIAGTLTATTGLRASVEIDTATLQISEKDLGIEAYPKDTAFLCATYSRLDQQGTPQKFCTHPYADKSALDQAIQKIREKGRHQIKMHFWEVPSGHVKEFISETFAANSIPENLAKPAQQDFHSRPTWEKKLLRQCHVALDGALKHESRPEAKGQFQMNGRTYQVKFSEGCLSVSQDNRLVYQCEAKKYPEIEPTPYEKHSLVRLPEQKSKPHPVPQSQRGGFEQ
ncbi:hypothetical protein ACQ4M3_07460 [Leptolyngbya sp. AN03gr2]|uniref:hypothetical protein n=1 Tax=unclassified Leptolyngbya TaxID=2650499 RepID=UPI003D31AD2B